MKALYMFALALVLGMALAGTASAAQYGNGGAGNQYSDTIAGDCIPNNTQDPDAVGDGTCDGTPDQDRLQIRDRDGTCDGDQTCDQDRLRTRDQISRPSNAEIATQIRELQRMLEQIRLAFQRVYGWQ